MRTDTGELTRSTPMPGMETGVSCGLKQFTTVAGFHPPAGVGLNAADAQPACSSRASYVSPL